MDEVPVAVAESVGVVPDAGDAPGPEAPVAPPEAPFWSCSRNDCSSAAICCTGSLDPVTVLDEVPDDDEVDVELVPAVPIPVPALHDADDVAEVGHHGLVRLLLMVDMGNALLWRPASKQGAGQGIRRQYGPGWPDGSGAICRPAQAAGSVGAG